MVPHEFTPRGDARARGLVRAAGVAGAAGFVRGVGAAGAAGFVRTVGAVALAALLALAPDGPRAACAAEAPAAQALDLDGTRRLAERDRDAAIAVLQAHLRQAPEDSDARVLLAAIFSWQGRTADARAEANRVLGKHPRHGDALRVLLRLEQWSGRHEAALATAERGLTTEPLATDLLLARVRALLALDRTTEAAAALATLHVVAPQSPELPALEDELRPRLRPWQASAAYWLDSFAGARAPDAWHEVAARVGRTTPIGLVLARLYAGRRFDLTDGQVEVELFPVLRPGTYFDVALAASPWHRLYPGYRAAIDGYQALGKGFELTLGYRRLGFAAPADLAVAGLALYAGDWLLSLKGLASRAQGAWSASTHGSVRRYWGSAGPRGWLGLRLGYGRGAARVETRAQGDSADSTSYAGGLEAVLPWDRWELALRAGYAAERQVDGRWRHQVTVAPELTFHF